MLDRHHRLMAVRVELLADGFDPGDAMALEYAFEFLRRHLDTGDDGFHDIIVARRFGDGGDGAGELVRDGTDVAGKAGRCIGGGLRLLALPPATAVFRLGGGARRPGIGESWRGDRE